MCWHSDGLQYIYPTNVYANVWICRCMQGLSEGLRNNQTIVELNLSGCNLTDEAVKVLASIIKVCSQYNLPHCQTASGSCQCMIGDSLQPKPEPQHCELTTLPYITVTCSNCSSMLPQFPWQRLGWCLLVEQSPGQHAHVLQANAAEADVQTWHEGLREYPDLSLEPHLRRRQFRARNQEIRGRVSARCGGLRILHLAENMVRHGYCILLRASLTGMPTQAHVFRAWVVHARLHSLCTEPIKQQV